MATMSSPQKRKMKTAHGPHGGGTEYEVLQKGDDFETYDDYTKNKDEPKEKTTPRLNKPAGYNQ